MPNELSNLFFWEILSPGAVAEIVCKEMMFVCLLDSSPQVILPVKNAPEEEYTIQNRATGENLQPPGAEGIEVQSGVKKGGWKVTGSASTGFTLASVRS